jgi:hypothetical protein
MKITYAITCADEEKQFRKLYETLRINKRDEDNILVLVDENKCPKFSDFHEFLSDLHKARYIKLISGNFDGHFGNWKNRLLEHPMIQDWAIFLDADELLPPQLIDDLPVILELNPNVDVIGLPRQNFVKDITPEYIQKWGWRIDEHQRINFPDVQFRIARNGRGIRWEGKVHETLVCKGIKTTLPLENNYAILHYKDLDRQIKQNNSYETGDYSK